MKKHAIKQISVFLENKPGRLARLAKAMIDVDVNILALNIAEAGDFGIVRMLVNDPKTAYEELQKGGFTVSIIDVIGIKIKNEPGELYKISKILGDANINIDYAYAYSGNSDAYLILRVSNLNEAIHNIEKTGLELMDDSVFG